MLTVLANTAWRVGDGTLAAVALARALRVPFDIAAPCAMIGTSNFFELAVAVAIILALLWWAAQAA